MKKNVGVLLLFWASMTVYAKAEIVQGCEVINLNQYSQSVMADDPPFPYDSSTVPVPPPPCTLPSEDAKEDLENKVFTVVEVPPVYYGGPAAIMSYLQTNIKYPPRAMEDGIQGVVLVKFVVELNGTVSDVQVVKAVDPLLDKEAIRVVSGMKYWIPGKQNGASVRCSYTLPVKFRLN